ncbi:MAG TPA: hypothetical protein VEK38_01590 [Candidatus Bathyarchaeia archaeon]|nr:hypothetical protein [Candidatus Bathyarchaeia archaeon]
MVTQQIDKAPSLHKKLDELILVIKRDTLFAGNAWQGIMQQDTEKYIERIIQHQEFQPRLFMETDPTYKQVIPYLIFTHDNRLFLMQRHAQASEKRLQNKYTLGIGGHIRQEDITGKDLISWADREFHEEISYTDPVKITPIGLLNDDSNPVGQVHVGLVFLVHGSSPHISVKSELAHGFLATYEECNTHVPLMETWSQIAYTALHKMFVDRAK